MENMRRNKNKLSRGHKTEGMHKKKKTGPDCGGAHL